jgi:transposase
MSSARRAAKQVLSREAGPPALAPGMYCRVILVGFFEGIESERGIA